MKRGPIIEQSLHSCCLVIEDPVRSDKLWHDFQIDKNQAFALWHSGRCRGQMYRGMLVVSRADVELLAERTAPVECGG
jgi:hypothetical protein